MYAVGTLSGKGGVGKSMFSSSLVQALLERDKKVGAIDADFSNPSLRRLLRMPGTPEIDEKKRLIPAKDGNLEFFSLDQVIEDRGVGMTGEEYAEIIRDVTQNGVWHADYMVVDLPAAISNEFRAMLSSFEDNYLGSIIVAQPAHLATTERVLKLHVLNGVPVLGLVENMTEFKCEHGTSYKPFGESGSDALAAKYGVKVLAKVPLSMEIQGQIAKGERVHIPDKEAVASITDAVLAARPHKLGFMAEMKEKAKELTRDTMFKLLVQSTLIVNRSVDINKLQKAHNFAGGQTIGMVVTGPELDDIRERVNFRVENGKLLLVQDPKKVDLWIYIKGIALMWAILGRKRFPDGREVEYDILDAYTNGDATVYGVGSVARAISFYKDIWAQAQAQLKPKLEPLISRLA